MLQIAHTNIFKINPINIISFNGIEKKLSNTNNTYILAFDLDGTFLECNKKDIEKFINLSTQKNHKLIYVSGRLGKELSTIREDYAQKGINIPLPDYFIANNGQFIYEKHGDKMSAIPLEEWNNIISKTNFNRTTVKQVIEDFINTNSKNSKPVMVQFDHKPSEFNVEYLVDYRIKKGLTNKLTQELKKHNIDVKVIFDYVPPAAVKNGLSKLPDFKEKLQHMVDKDGGILALNIAAVNKADAVEFIRNKLNIEMNRVVTAGNGANDLSLAAKGYWFILVNNAQKILRELIKNLSQDKIIQATKDGAAGINEALEKIFAKVGLVKT
ncbi:MAG: HAD-IIB family hydrolase [Cyanobacteriota bacterium]